MIMKLTEPKINVIKSTKKNTETTFEISGLAKGMASGYASALRTVLYEHVPGYGPIGFKLLGAKNIMDVLPQYTEPLKIISLAIERARVKSEDLREKTLVLNFVGNVDGDLLLGDFTGENVVILNPELRILTTSQKQQVSMKIAINLGVGFLKESSNITFNDVEGIGKDLIRVNTEFCPVTFVNFKIIENLPTEGKDTLRFDVRTNGTIDTKAALSIASDILITHLNPLSNLYKVTWEEMPMERAQGDRITDLDLPIEEIDLSKETYNVLKRDFTHSLRDLRGAGVRYDQAMVDEIIKALRDIGFTEIGYLSAKDGQGHEIL